MVAGHDPHARCRQERLGTNRVSVSPGLQAHEQRTALDRCDELQSPATMAGWKGTIRSSCLSGPASLATFMQFTPSIMTRSLRAGARRPGGRTQAFEKDFPRTGRTARDLRAFVGGRDGTHAQGSPEHGEDLPLDASEHRATPPGIERARAVAVKTAAVRAPICAWLQNGVPGRRSRCRT
jgi:hypothetical protein